MARKNSPEFECIVAHYNEELSWLEELAPDTIIYSKGNTPASGSWKEVRTLPNIGREAHTYLHHLVTYYDSIADVTLFVQGDAYNPDGRTPPHSTVPVPEMKSRSINSNSTSGFTCFTPVVPNFDQWSGLPWETDPKFRWWFHKNGKTMLRAQLTPAEFWTEYIGGPHPESVWFASGAFFGVTRETVQARPKSFYEKLLKAFTDANHRNPEYGHYVERLWGSIFLDHEGALESRRGSVGSDSDDASRTSQDSDVLRSRTEILLDIAETLPPLPFTQEDFAKKREAWMKEETEAVAVA
ncbi:uncharacterized protein BDZ99DRAFT_434293 [Mytilinidion resinicola]|uniref:Uncharacterized protein n=1 Tax=Mytilinidion resinicola TaxID=574789 RepID=A0A6A6Z1I6_9PEZI|nr:uncharacterized protein BDZ99DRAFT_434293 [Mytilinidion resinicola]KAF2814589.1 hypothetical protein BDZ99DRAFT_434293 [Mytilinidion resinicola]